MVGREETALQRVSDMKENICQVKIQILFKKYINFAINGITNRRLFISLTYIMFNVVTVRN